MPEQLSTYAKYFELIFDSVSCKIHRKSWVIRLKNHKFHVISVPQLALPHFFYIMSMLELPSPQEAIVG